MQTYKEMLYQIIRRESSKFDEDKAYIQRRRKDLNLWVEAQLLTELSWAHKFKGKLYKYGTTDQIIKSYARGRILDVGCGSGNLCFMLSEDPSLIVLGIETNWVWVDLANRLVTKLGRPNLRFECRDFLKNGVKGRFDTVIFSFMLHDIERPLPYIDYAFKVLAQKGQILIADLEITYERLSKFRINDFQDLGSLWSHNREAKMVFFRISPP